MRTIIERIKDLENDIHKLEGINNPSFLSILDGIIWELVKIKALKEKQLNDQAWWDNHNKQRRQ